MKTRNENPLPTQPTSYAQIEEFFAGDTPRYDKNFSLVEQEKCELCGQSLDYTECAWYQEAERKRDEKTAEKNLEIRVPSDAITIC
jgi:hypothetical protein